MPEFKKREIAYKMRIGEILKGKPAFSILDGKERFNFLELGDKKIVRVNVIANVIDKFLSEGANNTNEQDGVVRKKFASLMLDDATGQINIRVFGEDVNKFNEISQGQTIMIIGVLRSYNNEVYILPEIIKSLDPRYLLIRKLEIEKSYPKKGADKETITALKDQIIEMIKKEEEHEGIEKEKLIMELSANPELINQEIRKLLEEGIIYEPRPNKVRYLG